MRMKEVNRIRDKLEKDIKTRNNLKKHYKKFYNALNGISIGCGSIATAMAGVTLGVMSNPVVVLPLAITNVTLGTVGTVSGIWAKMVTKRIKKHEKLFLLASSALRTVNELLSESLKDSHISDKEFKLITQVYEDYLFDCRNTKDIFYKKNLVEKDQVIKKINNALEP